MKTLTKKRREQIKARYHALFDELLLKGFSCDVCTTIYDAYEKPSQLKKAAWINIRNYQKEYNGTMPLILSHNWYAFTACFSYLDENGNVRYKYFTKDYEYDFE